MAEPAPSTMSIAEVLSEIRSSTDLTKPFALRFVRGSGKKIGSICMIPQAIKGHLKGAEVQTSGNASGKYLYKDHDTIPIIDLERDRWITVLISHIIQYNHFKVIH